jgi:hypothetical protein
MPIHILTQQEGALPMPVPSSEDDLGACIRFLRQEGYDDSDQRVAICLAKFRESEGGGAPAGRPNQRGATRGARPAMPRLPQG